MSKKGQDLSIGTLILIVLGIIVLVLLILGFSMGWSNLWAKINIFGGGSGDISAKVTACNLAVTSNSVFDYCDFKEISVDGKKEWVNCEDDRVATGVETKLTCPGGNETVRAGEKCKELITSEKAKVGTKVNKFVCWKMLKCGELDAEELNECKTGQKEIPKDAVKELAGNMKCCTPKSP